MYGAVLVLTAFAPLVVTTSIAAADDGGTPPPCVAPANNQNGVHNPVGSDAGTFTYRCNGVYAGLYTNAYYSYNPITTQRTALYSPDYSYNCSTGAWSMTEWDYSPASGSYSSNRVTPSTAPNIATGCPTPAPPTPAPSTGGGSGIGSSGSSGANAGSASSTAGPTTAVSNTGPDSTNSTNGTITLNGTTNNNTGINMGNTVSSQAGTGNTFVIGNTSGGNATSGDASAIANIANLLQSTSNVFGPGTNTFVANINGDVNGDFMFDPSALLANTGPDSTNTAKNNLQVNQDTANTTGAQINNTVNLGATTGDATVANNTSGGNATSGNATAIANLMNLINSTVTSGQSFVGTININGNLNGDILLPQNLIDQLIASTGPGSSNGANGNIVDNSTTNNTTNESIANNITNTATTGNATVANNTSGGNATSGAAGSNVTIMNLTGSNVIGKNNILVFVNVLGHWIGMIVDAPAGSTSASLGGDISNTGPDSTNSTNASATSNSTTNNTAKLGITNNVNVAAASGDASVTGNTSGGNATTGNANTAVNILNIAGSNLNLSDWFGVLFINVFGNWTGSFGVNTSAGDPVVATTTTSSGGTSGSSTKVTTSQSTPAKSNPFVSFVASESRSGSGSSNDVSSVLANSQNASSVLGSKTVVSSTNPTPDNKTHADFTIPAIGIIIAAIMLIGERIVTIRKNNKVA